MLSSGYEDEYCVVTSCKLRDVLKYGELKFYFSSSEFNSKSYAFEFEDGEEDLRQMLLELLSKESSFGSFSYSEPKVRLTPKVIKTRNGGLRVIA